MSRKPCLSKDQLKRCHISHGHDIKSHLFVIRSDMNRSIAISLIETVALPLHEIDPGFACTCKLRCCTRDDAMKLWVAPESNSTLTELFDILPIMIEAREFV